MSDHRRKQRLLHSRNLTGNCHDSLRQPRVSLSTRGPDENFKIKPERGKLRNQSRFAMVIRMIGSRSARPSIIGASVGSAHRRTKGGSSSRKASNPEGGGHQARPCDGWISENPRRPVQIWPWRPEPGSGSWSEGPWRLSSAIWRMARWL